jgi:hypothetical protein
VHIKLTPKVSPLVHASILLFAFVLCSLLAVTLGKEINWDLASYHYYNPYAFIHHRANIDFWPASYVQIYFPPTIDFLTYFLLQFFSPHHAVFILGGIHGINFWLLFGIAYQLLSKNYYRLPLAIIMAALGLYGPLVLPGIGSFQNDNLVSLFVLSFVWLQLRLLEDNFKNFTSKKIILSSFILGVGTAIKLTAGLFLAGTLIAYVFLPLSSRVRFKLILLVCVGFTLGFLLTNGYWMWDLWRRFHNPMFPFLGAIFPTAGVPAMNWHDLRFMPHGLLQTLFYPFYFSWNGQTSDMPFRDFRFPVVYVLFVMTAWIFVWCRRYSVRNEKVNYAVTWLCLFFVASYIVWQYYFSISRYIVTLEMLVPLMIYLLLRYCHASRSSHLGMMALIFSALLLTEIPAGMVRTQSFTDNYFNVTIPQVILNQPQASVLVAYPAYALWLHPRPQTYLVPFFPKNWRFIGVPFVEEHYVIPDTVRALVKQSAAPLYLLTEAEMMPEFYRMAAAVGLRPNGVCYKIGSDRQRITHEDVLLCPVCDSL